MAHGIEITEEWLQIKDNLNLKCPRLHLPERFWDNICSFPSFHCYLFRFYYSSYPPLRCFPSFLLHDFFRIEPMAPTKSTRWAAVIARFASSTTDCRLWTKSPAPPVTTKARTEYNVWMRYSSHALCGERSNILGCQYHPKKQKENGMSVCDISRPRHLKGKSWRSRIVVLIKDAVQCMKVYPNATSLVCLEPLWVAWHLQEICHILGTHILWLLFCKFKGKPKKKMTVHALDCQLI